MTTTATAPNGHDFPVSTETIACILSGIAYEGRNGKISQSDLEWHAEHLISGRDFRNLIADLFERRIIKITTSILITGLGYELDEVGQEWLEQLS